MSYTPSQTVGPYLSIGLPWPDGPFVVDEGVPGAFWLHGVVTDGAGDPVPDALVETWQADPGGRFDHPDDPRGAVPGFRGFGRCPTDDSGRYAIRTLKPGPVPGPGAGAVAFSERSERGGQSPGAGNVRSEERSDEDGRRRHPGLGASAASADQHSPGDVPQAPHIDVSVFARGLLHRVVTRVYFADEEAANAADAVLAGVPEARRGTLLAVPDETGYRFDIRLQGDDETVFFAI